MSGIEWERVKVKFKPPTWRTRDARGRIVAEVYAGKGGWHYAIGGRDGVNAGCWVYATQAAAACEQKLQELSETQVRPGHRGRRPRATQANVASASGCSEVGQQA